MVPSRIFHSSTQQLLSPETSSNSIGWRLRSIATLLTVLDRSMRSRDSVLSLAVRVIDITIVASYFSWMVWGSAEKEGLSIDEYYLPRPAARPGRCLFGGLKFIAHLPNRLPDCGPNLETFCAIGGTVCHPELVSGSSCASISTCHSELVSESRGSLLSD